MLNPPNSYIGSTTILPNKKSDNVELVNRFELLQYEGSGQHDEALKFM